MRRVLETFVLFAVAALLLLAAAAFRPPVAHADGAAGTFQVGGGKVRIFNFAGKVDVVAGEGDAVVVEVRPGGKDAAKLGVTTLPAGDSGEASFIVTNPASRIVYPDGQGHGSRSRFDVAPDGRFGDGWGRWPAGKKRRVEIAGSGSGVEAWADLTVRVPRGRSVALHLGVGGVQVTRLEGGFRAQVAAGPVSTTGTRGELAIETGSGGVTVRDAQGDLAVSTGSGAISLDGLRGDRLRVETGSGGIRAVGVTGTEFSCESGSGSVDLLNVKSPKVRVESGSGSVRLRLGAGVDDLTVQTGSGGITLEAPDVIDAALMLETGSGGIHCELPVRVQKREDNHLEGLLGGGRGRIQLETGSGSIHVVRAPS
jgi:hypothetical protein